MSKDVESVWMYKGSDGEWKPFTNEQHRLNTIADGGWDVREFFAAPPAQGEPVGWQFYESGKWWNGDDRIKDHRKNTEAAGVPVRDVYAAPQPAPDVQGLTEALRQYQHNDGSGLVFGYDRLLVDQYVAGLVEALSALRGCIMETRGPDAHSALVLADAALAAYRKGGEA